MGADIHIYAEKLNKETNQWEILMGYNKYTNRERMQLMAGLKPDADEREQKRFEWIKNRITKLDSGQALREALEEQGAGHLYYEGMENGEFNIGYFKEKLTEEEFKSMSLYEIEDSFIKEADFLPLGRNYDAFAILADVRNGRGFAGIVTGGGFNIIAEPKGVPDDASDYYKHKVEEWDSDGHSHSYFTVAELKAFNWDQTTSKTGLVNFGVPESDFGFGDTYAMIKDKGLTQPESYFGGGSGVVLTVEQADTILELLGDDRSEENLVRLFREGLIPFEIEKERGFFGASNGFYTNEEIVEELTRTEGRKLSFNVRMHWEEDYREASGNYYDVLVNEVPNNYPEATDDEIRYVFFFDN